MTASEPCRPRGSSDDEEPSRDEIRTRAKRIKREELQRAFDRLEAHDTLTEEQRQVITELATAIVEGIVPDPDQRVPDSGVMDDTAEHEADLDEVMAELFRSDQ